MNFFVSIGAGLNQIPLIVEAKRQGFHVIGVDTNPMAPGFMHCDLKIQESITDHDEIYRKLNEMLFDGGISGIMSRSYGEAIRTTACLSERFNIPFMPFEKCEYFINKRLMKELFVSSNIPTPEPLVIPAASRLDKLSAEVFPIIKKPVEGHAKIGVKLIINMKELRENLSTQEEKKSMVFEKYIDGDEIIAAGIVCKGQFHLVDITDKTTTKLPYFVDLMHVSPSKYYHLYDEIKNIGQAVTSAFSIATSPVIMEFIVDKNEKLHLIEAVPEFGGEFLADIAIPGRTGYNFIGESIRANTASAFRIPQKKKIRNAVAVKYITASTGSLQSYNPEAPSKIRNVSFFRVFKDIGAETKPPSTNLDRIGVVISSGKTPSDAIAVADKAIDSLQLRIKK